jgi:hypothetical protein
LTRGTAHRKIFAPGDLVRMPKRFRIPWLGITICAAVLFAGCSHKDTLPLTQGDENSPALAGTTPVEAPLDQQTEQKLDPLTQNDVDLYLKVMRVAAERVKNPMASDKAALDGEKKILAGSASGRVPTPDDVKTLERANLVAVSMDQVVAEDMKVDGRMYRGIAEAVESAVPSPDLATAHAAGGMPVPPALPPHAPTPLEKRLSEVNTTNQKFLAPYNDEIQKLIAVVRNQANLPK